MMGSFSWSTGRLGDAMAEIARRRITGFEGNGQANLDRIHLFAGTFRDEAAMFAYCFSPIAPNAPEQLNLDLPEAPINTQLVDAAFGDQIIPRLSEYFGRKSRRRIMRRMQPANALVLIPMQAFGGMEFRLHDTAQMRHIGFEKSLVPETCTTFQ